ncbi:hypothetical protein OU994_05005 [Pseudoduganella sp. SL102]|uniref:hypothetical protein n=1 Tax=Pseudoduganella sp. SL102 TaxID=2995154 RepID=UPI00248B32B2|nr:hypothetical protein [Pseudoduganella sp. SL102]WBS03667.1 hypothetical protein OU994_05005 [Pseudoduganella sp. SL102]
MELDVDMFSELTPAGIVRMLDSDIADLRAKIEAIDADLQSLGDVNALKAWLKHLPNPGPQRNDDLFW